ncbi:hypothetical protein C8R44DRAFT_761374 [Mycena epipterygia]|nr:hypothetical protein C8R44DRAFT_761374 [Mycena epipterygia]
MVFGEESAKAHPYAFFTIQVDLRRLYGVENMFATRRRDWDAEYQPDESEVNYIFYHNISPQLPVNVAMARLLGVHTYKPGRHFIWRGDVIVVRERKWPGVLTRGDVREHLGYIDMPPHAMDLLNSRLIPEWYREKTWEDFLQWEEQGNVMIRPAWNLGDSLYEWVSGKPDYYWDMYDKNARLIKELKAIELDHSDVD